MAQYAVNWSSEESPLWAGVLLECDGSYCPRLVDGIVSTDMTTTWGRQMFRDKAVSTGKGKRMHAVLGERRGKETKRGSTRGQSDLHLLAQTFPLTAILKIKKIKKTLALKFHSSHVCASLSPH